MEQAPPERPVIFFDGICNLCNRVVQFIIKHDRGQFRFASLQSVAGSKLLERIKKKKGYKPDSIVLLHKGVYYIKSDAALKIGTLLKGGWQLLGAGYIFPRFVRDFIYDSIAKLRYKLFGKRNECMIPTPELRSRFIDD